MEIGKWKLEIGREAPIINFQFRISNFYILKKNNERK